MSLIGVDEMTSNVPISDVGVGGCRVGILRCDLKVFPRGPFCVRSLIS